MNINCSIHASFFVRRSAIVTLSASVCVMSALRVIRRHMIRSAKSIARKRVEMMNMTVVMDIRKTVPFIL